MTTQQAARVLGVSVHKLAQMRMAGVTPRYGRNLCDQKKLEYADNSVFEFRKNRSLK